MAHQTGGRAQTTGLGGATTFEDGIYATYSAPVLARDAVQPVDLPGFFGRSSVLQSRRFSMPASDPSAWVVHKFGGSSVADAECFRRVANILETLPPGRLGVVLSACRGVTDALLGLVAQAEAQDDGYRGDLDALRARHAKIAETVLPADTARLYMAALDRDRHDI